MLLLDLDNTLIYSKKADHYAIKKITQYYKLFQFNSQNEFINLYQKSREKIKKVLSNKPENRLRLLYFKEICEIKFNQTDINWITKINDFYLYYFKDYLKKNKAHYKTEYNTVFSLLEKIQKKTKIYFITNGILEIQLLKLKTILPKKIKYNLICSQEVGYEKPNKEIFHIALKNSKNNEKNIMIGDSYEDDVESSFHLNFQSIYLLDIFSKNTNIYKESNLKEYLKTQNLITALSYVLKEL